VQIVFAKRWESRPSADLVAIPFWKGEKGAILACDEAEIPQLPQAAGEDFSGDKGQFCTLYNNDAPEPRVVLMGLGKVDEVTPETVRAAYAALTNLCREKKLQKLNIAVPQVVKQEIAGALVEGICLANYAYSQRKIKKGTKEKASLTNCTLIGCSAASQKAAVQASTICLSVDFVRDLINGNADDVTPQYLAKCAQDISKTHKSLSVTVFDKKRITKEGMGLILAVNRGAAVDPRFIILEYKGDPKSKDRTVLVGKGVTFDTGGLQVKPHTGMEHMRSDMGGAGVVLGTMKAIAELKLKVNVEGVIPSVENAIGSLAYKPGDIYHSYNDTAVEIVHTDAEGRLILADALSYVVKNLKPTRVIDIATLTGAVIVALGDEVAGMWSNNDTLATDLAKAGEITYERVWRLPLVEEYKSQLKSDRADLKNTGGSSGSSIVAALFLQNFVENVPWAHLDIAGVRFLNEAKRYRSKGATGYGVRLLCEYLMNIKK